MRSTPSPKEAKNSGKMPQLIPSLRLLTSPACEAANRLRSLNEVSAKTSRKPIGVACRACDEASSRTWSRVSRTNRIDSAAPKNA